MPANITIALIFIKRAKNHVGFFSPPRDEEQKQQQQPLHLLKLYKTEIAVKNCTVLLKTLSRPNFLTAELPDDTIKPSDLENYPLFFTRCERVRRREKIARDVSSFAYNMHFLRQPFVIWEHELITLQKLNLRTFLYG